MSTTTNAKITAVTLSIANHGVLTSSIHLDFKGGGQAFGGFQMGLDDPTTVQSAAEPNYASHWICRILKVAGVLEWNQLPYKNVRVVHNEKREIVAIGHIVDDYWFTPRDDFKSIAFLFYESIE